MKRKVGGEGKGRDGKGREVRKEPQDLSANQEEGRLTPKVDI